MLVPYTFNWSHFLVSDYHNTQVLCMQQDIMIADGYCLTTEMDLPGKKRYSATLDCTVV
jgi:hypothetical protein